MAKQSSVVATAMIHAPVEQVWDRVSDAGGYAKWVEGTLEVLRSESPMSLGSTYEELTRISGPWKAKTRWRVTEFDPPRRQVHAGEGVVTSTDLDLVIELSPKEEGTELTLTLRYTPRFGPIGALIDASVRRSLKNSQQRSAEAFARLVEGRP